MVHTIQGKRFHATKVEAVIDHELHTTKSTLEKNNKQANSEKLAVIIWDTCSHYPEIVEKYLYSFSIVYEPNAFKMTSPVKCNKAVVQ